MGQRNDTLSFHQRMELLHASSKLCESLELISRWTTLHLENGNALSLHLGTI